MFQVVENAVLAAADQIAALGHDENAGGAEILILVLATEVAERAPKVGQLEFGFAVVDASDARCVAELHEALTEVAGHRAGIHAVAGCEVDVVAIDRGP